MDHDHDHDWLELAKEAAVLAADFFDRGGPQVSVQEWHDITMRRAAIAQTEAQTRIAVALEKIAEKLSYPTER